MKNDLILLAQDVGNYLLTHKLILASAESCTGGLIAEVITAVPGSSQWFDRGFVTYSNAAKIEMLDVPATVIETHGAVSHQTAYAMAEGALVHSHANISLAVTGIAGPDGGTKAKPVGTVCFAWSMKNFSTQTKLQLFTGDRLSIRHQAAQFALEQLIAWYRNNY